jgi:hypothetical protein
MDAHRVGGATAGRKKKVGAAVLLDGEGAPGTSTAPGVATQLREGN